MTVGRGTRVRGTASYRPCAFPCLKRHPTKGPCSHTTAAGVTEHWIAQWTMDGGE
jgi:hypothetical protein